MVSSQIDASHLDVSYLDHSQLDANFYFGTYITVVVIAKQLICL